MNFFKKFLLLFLALSLVACKPASETAEDDDTTNVIDEEPPPVVNYFPIDVVFPGTDVLIMAGSSFTYNVSGGNPPYSYELIAGPGSVGSTGIFMAGEIVGNSVIDISDQSGQTVQVKVRVNPILKVEPELARINISSGVQLNVSGGVPPYSYFIENGSGSFSGLGFYNATSTPATTRIRIYDNLGNNVVANVESNFPLKINPTSASISRGASFVFEGKDGFPPYTYRVIGNGNVNSFNGTYTAPQLAGTAKVEVLDSKGNTAEANITISNQPLNIDPQNLTVEVNRTFGFKASGGLAPYTFRKVSGNGDILPSGTYYAPSTPSSDVVEVVDSENTSVFANITVSNQLSITPNQTATVPNGLTNFNANGGVPPYTFQVLSGGGSIVNTNDNAVGQFTAPPATGTTSIQLRDSANTIVTATIYINPRLDIFPINPTISVGNSLSFIGSGGIPPYEFNLISGPGIMNVNGTYTGDNGTFFENQTAVVEIRDSASPLPSKVQTTITITPNLRFAESDITVKSGTQKIIEATGGVPPYRLRFKNGSSVVGSTILNIPTGNNYVMRYTPGFVNDDVIEKLEIFDSLNNTVSQNITIFGGLVAYYDPDKARIASQNNLIVQNGLQLTSNSDLASITKLNHGLTSSSTVRIKDATGCGNIDDYELNKRFQFLQIDSLNNFSVKLDRKANQNILCGDGSSIKYDVLSNMNSLVCPAGGTLGAVNLKNYLISDISVACSANGATLFSGSCGKTPPTCTDPYRVTMSRASVADNVNRHLNITAPLTQDEDTYVSVELWFKWNGDRSPSNVNPPVASFNGTLVGFNNYNASFITILENGNAVYSLCFNTQIGTLDCFGMRNPDALISNRWSQIVLVFNNGDVTKNKIYINGEPRSAVKIGTATPAQRFVSNDLKIGVNHNNNSAFFRTRGELGITRVYDKELNSNEILQNYNQFKCLYQSICN